jgi:hypothetical protein
MVDVQQNHHLDVQNRRCHPLVRLTAPFYSCAELTAQYSVVLKSILDVQNFL